MLRNHQPAIGREELADKCDALIVLVRHLSNSNRLAEVALTMDVRSPRSPSGQLTWRTAGLMLSTLGITAGASAPEVLVQALVDALSYQFDVSVEELNVINEDVTFSLPRALSA